MQGTNGTKFWIKRRIAVQYLLGARLQYWSDDYYGYYRHFGEILYGMPIKEWRGNEERITRFYKFINLWVRELTKEGDLTNIAISRLPKDEVQILLEDDLLLFLIAKSLQEITGGRMFITPSLLQYEKDGWTYLNLSHQMFNYFYFATGRGYYFMSFLPAEHPSRFRLEYSNSKRLEPVFKDYLDHCFQFPIRKPDTKRICLFQETDERLDEIFSFYFAKAFEDKGYVVKRRRFLDLLQEKPQDFSNGWREIKGESIDL